MQVQGFLSNKNNSSFVLANFNLIDSQGKCTQHIVEINDANAYNPIFQARKFSTALFRHKKGKFQYRFCADDESSDNESNYSCLTITVHKGMIMIVSIYKDEVTVSQISIPTDKVSRKLTTDSMKYVSNLLLEGADEWYGKCYDAMCDD
jgi:hypothetical protein